MVPQLEPTRLREAVVAASRKEPELVTIRNELLTDAVWLEDHAQDIVSVVVFHISLRGCPKKVQGMHKRSHSAMSSP